MKYAINLIRQIRIEEHKVMLLKNHIFTLAASCSGLLVIAILVLGFKILQMQISLKNERQQVNRIEMEYGKYKATKMVIDKADIERLDSLQANRTYWTKKIAAMAYYLPENYWITKFSFDGKMFNVGGYGYITQDQQQLITLDDYLNKLRADSTFNDVFKTTYFNSVQRSDEEGQNRVSFEYSSMR
jgi:Tfp pilus assembly protein PilN